MCQLFASLHGAQRSHDKLAAVKGYEHIRITRVIHDGTDDIYDCAHDGALSGQSYSHTICKKLGQM